MRYANLCSQVVMQLLVAVASAARAEIDVLASNAAVDGEGGWSDSTLAVAKAGAWSHSFLEREANGRR
jgi:hypothetical protein